MDYNYNYEKIPKSDWIILLTLDSCAGCTTFPINIFGHNRQMMVRQNQNILNSPKEIKRPFKLYMFKRVKYLICFDAKCKKATEMSRIWTRSVDKPQTSSRCCRIWSWAARPRRSGCSRWGRHRSSASCERDPAHTHSQVCTVRTWPSDNTFHAHRSCVTESTHLDEVKLVSVPCVFWQRVCVVQDTWDTREHKSSFSSLHTFL